VAMLAFASPVALHALISLLPISFFLPCCYVILVGFPAVQHWTIIR
jgi:hypothetical protein